MDKITFEEGTLVTPAKVNEDGTITPAVWEGSTPLTPHTLNLIQDNIETAISESKITVIDNLTSTSTTDALSANQGYLLGNRVTALEKASFCRMSTNFEIKTITENTKIEGFRYAQNFGDYIADVDNSRLVIKNTTLCQLNGLICGHGYTKSHYGFFDSDGNQVITDSRRDVLYQFAGNSYFQAPLPTLTIELDPNKTYYIYLYVDTYGSETFSLNNGFGADGTWISATKIL